VILVAEKFRYKSRHPANRVCSRGEKFK